MNQIEQKAMEQKSAIRIFEGFPPNYKKLPVYCENEQLGNRFAVAFGELWKETEFVLSLVRRVLKLFPFEKMEIEVDRGRSRDVFEDWDGFLDWFRADNPSHERYFSRIKVLRKQKVLGYLEWEGGAKQPIELAVYTTQNQSGPLSEACQAVCKSQDPQKEMICEKGTRAAPKKRWKFFF